MTNALFLDDAYLKQCEAKVIAVNQQGTEIILDKTIFYPMGGGQPHDEGTIKRSDEMFKVSMVKKSPEGITHEVDREGLKVHDVIECSLNWKRRYNHMRHHTAMHVLSAELEKEAGTHITGNQIGAEKSRIDIDLKEFSREVVEKVVNRTNELIKKDAVIKSYVISREEALRDETLVKLAKKEFLEKLEKVRIVEIGNIDRQADGGTHVRSLSEVGKIIIEKIENRGKKNRRIYFTLTDSR